MSGTPSHTKADLEAMGLNTEQYVNLTDWEHLDRRPDMYIGAMDVPEGGVAHMEIYTSPTKEETEGETKKPRKPPKLGDFRARPLACAVPPALLNIFEEITQNAMDKAIEDPTTTAIKVDVRMVDDAVEVSVWNNGEGIPSYVHAKTGLPVPTMLFALPKTSDKYDDDKKRMAGGKNGWGAKATNFFSSLFRVETLNTKMGTEFSQTFRAGPGPDGKRAITWDKPRVKKMKRSNGYTRVTFRPDLARFGLAAVPPGLVTLLRSKVWDLAACTPKRVSVHLDGVKLPVATFTNYVALFGDLGTTRPPVDEVTAPSGATLEIGVLPVRDGDAGFDVGFVNGLRCCAGRHVDYARDAIAKLLAAKLKTPVASKRTYNLFHLFVRLNMSQPQFDSQTKSRLTSTTKAFGVAWTPTKPFFDGLKRIGVVDAARAVQAALNDRKAMDAANKALKSTVSRTVRRAVVDVPNLRDANLAGERGSDCTLILAEGLSATAAVEPGLAVLGSDEFGILPVTGKIPNVSDPKCTLTKVLANERIRHVVTALGLQYDTDYGEPAAFRSLRYKRVWLMMDQDTDGSHICGLVLNLLRTYFRSLLERGFVYRFATPLIRVVPKATPKSPLEFYAAADFEAWRTTPGRDMASFRDPIYLKGLATSTQEDMRRYMANYPAHIVRIDYGGDAGDAAMDLYFAKGAVRSDKRKDVLLAYDPSVTLSYDVDAVTAADFLDKEMKHYSWDSVVRAIPCAVDGMVECQRKILYTALAKKVHARKKTAQFAADVSAFTKYHHGEKSVEDATSQMAQEHPCSNNLNYLFPDGAFGSRSKPRKVHGSSRYTFTYLNAATRALFPDADTPVLRRVVDEEALVEPVSYAPIVPGILLNGKNGIGTGWSSNLMAFSPEEVLDVQAAFVAERGATDGAWVARADAMLPWYFMYGGTITQEGPAYVARGVATVGPSTTHPGLVDVVVTELPVATWTDVYAERMKQKHQTSTNGDFDKQPKFVLDIKNSSTNVKVHVRLQCSAEGVAPFLEGGAVPDGAVSVWDHPKLAATLELLDRFSRNNTHLLDVVPCGPDGKDWTYRVVKTPTVSSIYKLHGKHRLAAYVDRKAFLLETWGSEQRKLAAQWRFVNAVMDGTLDLRRKASAVIEGLLTDAGYPTDAAVAPPPPPSDRDLKVRTAPVSSSSVGSDDPSESGSFKYLTSMPMSSFSKERLAKLEAKTRDVGAKASALRAKDPWDMWADDLAAAKPKVVAFMAEKETRALAMPESSGPTRGKANPKTKRKPRAKRTPKKESKSKPKPKPPTADVSAFFG